MKVHDLPSVAQSIQYSSNVLSVAYHSGSQYKIGLYNTYASSYF
jgi:hypothetical protein